MREKKLHPYAEVLSHPECTEDVLKESNAILSTNGIINHVKESKSAEFIIGTENGIIHRLKKENPSKEFYPASPLAICPNMKRINLEKLLWSLQETKYEIVLPKEIIEKAKTAIEKMIK